MKKKIQKNQCKLPSELKIFSKIYKIIYLDKISEVDKKNESILYGQVSHDDHIIRIYRNKSRQKAEIWHTLWHEILHIIFNCLAINIDEVGDFEKFIDNISLAIMHVCIENKLDFSK